MQKLIEAFIKNPSPESRKKLQSYLNKHPMAVAMNPEAAVFLLAHGFAV